MSNLTLDDLACRLNKTHLICVEPVKLKCIGTGILSTNNFVCLNCIEVNADYIGSFKCLLCNGEHTKDALLSNADEVQASRTAYNEFVSNNMSEISSRLLEQHSRLCADLKGNNNNHSFF
jgi:hypothetical protein